MAWLYQITQFLLKYTHTHAFFSSFSETTVNDGCSTAHSLAYFKKSGTSGTKERRQVLPLGSVAAKSTSQQSAAQSPGQRSC